MAADAGNILDEYAKQWGPLPITNIAISPIPGTFGQGFPGLIYLSMLSYMRENERPKTSASRCWIRFSRTFCCRMRLHTNGGATSLRPMITGVNG